MNRPPTDEDMGINLTPGITVYFKDNTSKKYEHIGNIYFVDSEKKWYKMTYKQAEKFEGIYNSLREE